jgi:hypothetical protein
VAREYGLYHNDHGAMRETFKLQKHPASCLHHLSSSVFLISNVSSRSQFATGLSNVATKHAVFVFDGATVFVQQRHVCYFTLIDSKQPIDLDL